jgi:hypothetical protein
VQLQSIKRFCGLIAIYKALPGNESEKYMRS